MDEKFAELEKFAEMVGKVTPAQIAEVAGVGADVVDAWLAARAESKAPPAAPPADPATKGKGKKGVDSKAPPPPAAAESKAPPAAPPADPPPPAPRKEPVMPAEKPARPRRIEKILVKATTKYPLIQNIEGKAPKKLWMRVIRSEYRGEIARKLAALLKADEFEVLAYADEG